MSPVSPVFYTEATVIRQASGPFHLYHPFRYIYSRILEHTGISLKIGDANTKSNSRHTRLARLCQM